MASHTVVVGGGVAGLVSALIARRKGANVTVVEQAPRAGGLWYSQAVDLAGENHILDHGLRLPLTSGLDEWDDDLFRNPRVDFDWLQFDGFPREAALFNGALTRESSCFDARLLGDDINAAGLLALIAAAAQRPNADPAAYQNDFEFITAHYGAIYRDHIFAPILRGFLKRELHELAPGVCRAIVPRRLIATGLADRDRLVSQQPELAQVLAHSEYAALPKDMARKFIYPRTGHISCWIDALQLHLQDLGVTFVFNAGVKAIEQTSSESARLTLSSGEVVQGDLVVWSLPLVFLAMMRPELGLKPVVPDFITLAVSHVKLDRPVNHESQYVLNYSGQPTLFRGVFRDNLLSLDSNILTLEQLLHIGRTQEPDSEGESIAACIADLKFSGMLAPETNVLGHQRTLHRNFLPILTPEYASFNHRLAAVLRDAFSTLVIVGRAGNGALFLDGIILDALSKLDERFSSARTQEGAKYAS